MATTEAMQASRMREGRMAAGMARFYRTLVGPAIVGVSVWCAAGTLSVMSNATTERLAAPAPWWMFIAAAIVAALVPNWRSRPITTLPALLSTLPWWPVPLPAVALLWTGPLTWVPIGAALFAAHGSRPLAWLSRTIGATEPAGATRLAAGASILIALLAAWSADPYVPGGDEPHYLVITQSLLKDGDLKIENNHVARDYASYFGGTIKPDFIARGQDGEIYSIHAPGVPALVLPAFALLGFRGAPAPIIFLFGIAGALMWRAAWRLTSDMSAAWFAWAALAGSTTMAVLSFMIFPETPGVCAVAAGVWLLASLRDASQRQVIAVSAALAALPWMHTRFAVIAGALGLAVTVLMLRDRTRAAIERWRRVLAFLAIPAVSAIAWFWMFHAIYGVFDPRAPYGSVQETRSWIWGAVTGLFVDQQFGLITYAPVLFAGFIGCLVAAPGRKRQLSLLAVGILLVYTMAVATYWMWWAGVPALPARFLTAALPLLVIPLSVTWLRSTVASRMLLSALLLVSLGITGVVLGVDRSIMAWNRRDGQALWLEWLNPVVNLPRAWPSFFWDGEPAFLQHAVVFSVIVLLVSALARMTARRLLIDTARARTGVALILLAGLVLIVQAGWTVTASEPLDPARSQLALHAAAGSGGRVWRIGRGLHRVRADATPLRIQPDQPPLADTPGREVGWFVNVPSGVYHLETSAGSLSGGLAIRIRREAPLQSLAVTAGQAQSFPIVLPAGAALLVIEADNPDLARQVQVALVPASPAGARSTYARLYRRYAGAEAYFLDDNVFPEADGFWVRGGRTAGVVLSQGSSGANRAGTLSIRNGASANTFTIRSDAWQEVLTLAAGETRVIALPVANAMGAWPLTITSSSGFRPSDTAGDDRRFLGVWIQLTR
jgi:hypothetical protein